MSYELENLESNQPLGVFTNASPLVAEFRCSSADSRSFVIALTTSAATGAGPTYATAAVQTTWDDGDTWVTVTGVELEAVDAVSGTFLVYATAIMSPVSPRCRVTWTPAVAHTITVSDLRKSRHAPGDSPISTPPNTTGGAANVTLVGPLGPQATAASIAVSLPTDQATQTAPLGVRETNGTDWLGTVATAAAQLTFGIVAAVKQAAAVVMGWDGTTHREIAVETDGNIKVAGLLPENWLGLTIAYPSGTQETYSYFEDAAKTVAICVVTIDYVDATKAQISSVTRA